MTRLDGEPAILVVERWEVGVTGDDYAWTVYGVGGTWQEALVAAADPKVRRRPAMKKPAAGGL